MLMLYERSVVVIPSCRRRVRPVPLSRLVFLRATTMLLFFVCLVVCGCAWLIVVCKLVLFVIVVVALFILFLFIRDCCDMLSFRSIPPGVLHLCCVIVIIVVIMHIKSPD